MSRARSLLPHWILAVLIVLLAATSPSAFGHEVRPAFLALTEVSDNTFDVTWKQPLLNDRRLRIDPVLPTDCTITARSADAVIPGALIRTWQVHCDASAFERQPVEISGLSSTLTDVWVNVRRMDDGENISALLTASKPRRWLSQKQSTSFASYFTLGVKHLLFGFDHVLFVMGLMFLVRGFPRLLMAITAFTVAHSITLAASTLNLMQLSQTPVEAAIALSVLFMAFEASSPDRNQTITARMPWLIAFAFGLLHGLGFSAALRNVGLPIDQATGALLFFNLGIEFGQLIVMSLFLGVLYAQRHWLTWRPRWLVHAPLYAMGTLSSYWLLQRAIPWTNF